MTKANITQYDSTPSNNADINDINIAENCPASNINNAIRELMAHLKNVDTGSQALTALSVTGALSAKGGAVFNEDSADVDFRVESNGDANMLFIDGGNDRLLVRKSDPTNADQAFHLGAGGDDHKMILQGNTVQRLGLQLGTDSRVFLGAVTGNHFRVSKQDASALFDVDPSGNIILGQSGAGIHLGVTSATASNLLDDYEEGTWTPTYTGGTAPTISYNTQDGKYTKIGQTVAFNCRIATNSKSGGSGSLYIAGLPFANSKISAGAVVAHSWLGEHPMKFRIVSSGIFLYYRSSLHGDDILANTQTADMNTSGSGANLVEVTGVYFTDS